MFDTLRYRLATKLYESGGGKPSQKEIDERRELLHAVLEQLAQNSPSTSTREKALFYEDAEAVYYRGFTLGEFLRQAIMRDGIFTSAELDGREISTNVTKDRATAEGFAQDKSTFHALYNDVTDHRNEWRLSSQQEERYADILRIPICVGFTEPKKSVAQQVLGYRRVRPLLDFHIVTPALSRADITPTSRNALEQLLGLTSQIVLSGKPRSNYRS